MFFLPQVLPVFVDQRWGHAGYLLTFALGKLLAFNFSVAARFPGDTLEPVLIAGAFLGGAIGTLGQRWWTCYGWLVLLVSPNCLDVWLMLKKLYDVFSVCIS